jgi:zinc/manganese transport system permease protein
VSDFLGLMAAPLAACVVLVGIHAYLGTHVIARGVIFVDLALAQVSALGAAIGLIAGYDLDSATGYLVSLGFALLGAAVLAASRTRSRQIPQEAVIGVAYAVASAMTLLVLDRAPHGGEHIKSLLLGSILWTGWDQVLKMAVTYATLGLVLWRSHERLHAISVAAGHGTARDRRALLGWDLVFYGIFAVVVTSSVRVAGVLLVFTFLIVPTLFGLLVAGTPRRRLIVAWIFGVVVSLVGCAVSYALDMPTGATVICAFGAAILAVALIRRWSRRPRRQRS